MTTTTFRGRGRRTIAALAALAALPGAAAAGPALAAAPLPTGTVQSPTAQEDAQLMLLVDGSRSMEDPDATGAPKIDAARTALDAVVEGLDPTQSVGMRIFGGTVPVDQPMADKCADSELVVPIGTDNATDLSTAIQDYTPTGETPIGLALQDAAEDLGQDGNRTILLVSDGIATCDPDPCEVAEQLTADGFDLQVHTVGLGVDDEARSQLQCIAEAAGGTYYDAEDTDTLTTALTRIASRAYRPFMITGEPVEGSTDPRSAPVLGPGQYVDTVATQQGLYYLIERSAPGTSLHVGATMRPDNHTSTSVVDLKLETLDGTSCDWEVASVWSAGASNRFGSGDVTGFPDGDDDPCGTDDQLLFSIAEQKGSRLEGQLVEIWVHEEEAASDTSGLPDNQDHAIWEDAVEIGEPVDTVIGGTSFTDATPLEAGQTYASDIVPGEILLFSVPLDWGQHVEALVEFPQPDPALGELVRSGTWAEVGFYGPDRGEAVSRLSDTGGVALKDQLSDSARTLVGGLTYDVNWHNRDWGNLRSADRPGDYYVAVSLVSDDDHSVPVPFTITTEVVGEVSGAPVYGPVPTEDDAATDEPTTDDDAATTSVPAEDATPGDGADETDEAAPPTSSTTGGEESGDGISPWIWALGGLGVALGAAGAFILSRRSGVA